MTWAVYVIAVIYYALIASLPVTLILLISVSLAFLDFWRNYFSGIILKLGGKLQIGDSISWDGHSGKILEFGYRTLKLINQEGEEMLIPYRLVDGEVKIGQKGTPKILSKTFTIDQLVENRPGIRQQIENAIYANPWIVISSPVQITLEAQRVTLNFYVLNQDFFEKAKYRLLKDLESLSNN